MSEETFRPQRKAISPEDAEKITSGQPLQGASASDMLKARMAEDTSGSSQTQQPVLHENDPPPEHFGKQKTFSNAPDKNAPTGEMPRELMEFLSKKGKQVPTGGGQPVEKNFLVNTDSDKLKELIQGIDNSHVIYHEVNLPSKGKFYNGNDGPTDGILHIRPMTGYEEQVLADPILIKQGKGMDRIFDQCIRENYSSANFLSVDRTYLFIYLRAISYSIIYTVEIKCPECDTKFSENINLNEIDTTYCPDNFSAENLSGTLPRTGYNFTYKLPSGDDELKIQAYRKNKLKNYENGVNPDDTILFRTSLLLNEVQGLTNKHELMILLKKLPIEDTNYLRNLVGEPPFGVETKIPLICPSCLAEFDMELPLEANFFFPKNKKMQKE